MALWNLVVVGDKVTLSYTAEPLRSEPRFQECGAVARPAMSDLEGWVFDEAAPFDLIRTPTGTFMRQTLTNGNALAMA